MSRKREKKKRRMVLKLLVSLLILIILFLIGILLYLWVTEYRPSEIEEISIESISSTQVPEEVKLVSWNIGYGGLDAKTDFFMDGGEMIFARSKEAVMENMQEITKTLQEINADFYLLQEVDYPSKRSFHVNEVSLLDQALYRESQFAYNYKVDFVPYPWPPLGKVQSGLYTASSYIPTASQRKQLPNPFPWPVRMANLKRGLLINRYLTDSGKELILVNLHLEAYDDGVGKEEQSKFMLRLLEQEYEKGNYVIAGGDWNQSFLENMSKYPPAPEGYWNPGKISKVNVKEGWQYITDESTPTSVLNNKPYEKGSPDTWYSVIDGYLISPNIQCKFVETLPLEFENSDHNPIITTLILGEAPIS